VPINAVVTLWYQSKLAESGKESPHLRSVHQWLEKLGNAFPAIPAASLTVADLRGHIEAASSNAKSRRDGRARVVALWKFAATHGIFVSTEADKLPAYKAGVDKSVVIWTPGEMKKLIDGCPAEFLPWLLISSFSGMRSEEVAPKLKSRKLWLRPDAPEYSKPPLRWEWIKLAAGYIDLPAECSKVRKRRLVPIAPTLKAWLKHLKHPKTGIVCPRLPAEHVCGSLGKLAGGWRKNALRHSYGSYRAAATKDLPALAIEMGTSVAMIEKHYREAVSESEAGKYWGILPG